MTPRTRAIALLVIQCLLVSSIAAKYLYERATRPRVWVRATQYDPSLPMRGRYLALQPLVDACDFKNLPPAKTTQPMARGDYRVRLVARDGKLVAEDAGDGPARGNSYWLVMNPWMHCEQVPVPVSIDYYVPENARSPFPLKQGQELWAEVTVPPSGPPRAIQLALSDNGKWQPLKFD
jgi:hypothetical protein